MSRMTCIADCLPPAPKIPKLMVIDHPPPSIDSLPPEVLVRIFHALPWKDRMRGVEGVCRAWRQLSLTRGWTDVQYFDEYLLYYGNSNRYTKCKKPNPHWRNALLERVCPHLRSAALYKDRGLASVILEKCPKLRNISMKADWLDLPTIELLRSQFRQGGGLKSLRIGHPGKAMKDAGVIHAFGDALCSSDFSALEFLQLCSLDYSARAKQRYGKELNFRASALGNLRHLSLGWLEFGSAQEMLGTDNIGVLASLPSLRSFCLVQGDPIPDLAFLQYFTCLEHLKVGLAAVNIRSFVDSAMPRLAATGRLKALEVYPPSNKNLIEVLERLVASLPQHLEHLSVIDSFQTTWVGGDREKTVVAKSLAQLASSHPQLRSLVFGFHCEFDERKKAGQWLERMQGLEFFHLQDGLPIDTLCRTIKICKNIRAIKLHSDGSYNAYSAIVDAAKECAASDNNATSCQRPKSLLVGLCQNDFREFSYANPTGVCGNVITVVDCPHLRFTRSTLESHVLHRYKYGCLSEGKPPIADYLPE